MIQSSCSHSRSSKPLSLFFKFFAVAAFVAGLAASCQAQDKIELFGGYSYFRASIREVQFTPCPICVPPAPAVTDTSQRANLNGWKFSGQFKLLPFLGAVADFDGTYGKLNGASTREHTFLFGPQVSLPTKVSPFVHALVGVAKESQDPIQNVCPVTVPTCTGFNNLGSDTSLATAYGAGIDIKLVPFIKLRLIQVDYLRTQLHGATQNQYRASAGIVFHF